MNIVICYLSFFFTLFSQTTWANNLKLSYHKVIDSQFIQFSIQNAPDVLGKNIAIKIDQVQLPNAKSANKCEVNKALKVKHFIEENLKKAKTIELEKPKREKIYALKGLIHFDGINLREQLIKNQFAYPLTQQNIDWCKQNIPLKITQLKMLDGGPKKKISIILDSIKPSIFDCHQTLGDLKAKELPKIDFMITETKMKPLFDASTLGLYPVSAINCIFAQLEKTTFPKSKSAIEGSFKIIFLP